jgi:two-component system, sensor histidine kinase PdtaS
MTKKKTDGEKAREATNAVRELGEARREIERLEISHIASEAALVDAEAQLLAAHTEGDQLRSHIAYQNVLFREVHHRIKNNLQILNSLVMMISGRFPDALVKAALQQLEDRISAISLVHELLYRTSDAATVDLGKYVQAVAASVWASSGAAEKGIALAVESRPCPASMDTAVSLGLLLTEVVTNAIKHAFPQGQTGNVRVSLGRQDDRWRLIVRDDGVGSVPEAQPKSGIGWGLVRSLASQLHGEITVRSENGTEVALSIPVESPERVGD